MDLTKDELAYPILPMGMKLLVSIMKLKSIRNWMVRSAEKDAPGMWGSMLCRKRYIDEKLSEAANQFEAVVNLGAGFDTRAYRFPFLKDIHVWEIDQHENIQAKQKRIEKVFNTIPSNVHLVGMNFDKERLESRLNNNGFSLEKKTFFIMEAVTQYLTEEGIKNTFDFLAKANSGSRLVFTYVLKDFINGEALYDWQRGYKEYVKTEVWKFGMDPDDWPDYLKRYGWEVIEDTGYNELADKYIRPTGRVLYSTPIERIIYAQKL